MQYPILPAALWLMSPWHVVLVFITAAVLRCPVLDLTKLLMAPKGGRKYFARMLWVRHRWHWLCRCTGLALPELAAKNRPVVESQGVFFTLHRLLRHQPIDAVGKIHYPRARKWRLTEFGWQLQVRTAPRVGRKEISDATDHLADYWRCCRVGVTQTRPGRLLVRGLRSDPLSLPFGPEECPAGTFSVAVPWRLYLGKDEFAEHRYLDIRGVTGICVAGLPGHGKTSLIASWLCQLSGSSCCQVALLDGKSGGDQVVWHDRSWRHGDDSLDAALDVLEDLHSELRRRLRLMTQRPPGSSRNAWHTGPTEDMPLMLTIIDECQQYMDIAAYKGDREMELKARRCIALAGQLIKKGRSVLFLTVLATQKATGDGCPTVLRDNSALAVSFALKTREAAVAALGEGIREYPDYEPSQFREVPGAAIATLPSGQDPYCRLRVPLLTEAWSATRARESVPMKRELATGRPVGQLEEAA